ncbi:MAG: nuclear transport factor 2 family protein [Paracoccaceae bacterium]
MYHAIVRRKINALFDAINRGDAEPVFTGFAARFEHVMLGNHALSGRRSSLALTRDWYGRLYRLLPDIHFDITRITIRGWPWNTVAYVEWREANSGTDGVRAEASGVHVVEIRWARMTRLLILPDTVKLVGTLERLALKGVNEAAAAPIEDLPGWPD